MSTLPPPISSHKPRIEFIDLAKGMCILWVVIMHCNLFSTYIPGINSSQMPLFFVLSGLFFKTYGSYGSLIIKKINSILIPFLFFYLLAYAIFYTLDFLQPGMIPQNQATGILDVFTQRTYFNGPIWFLICLFWMNAIFGFIALHTTTEWQRAGLVLAITGVGVTLGKAEIFIPMSLDVACSSLIFFYMGYLLKQTKILYPNKYDKYNLVFCLACFATTLIIELLIQQTGIASNTNQVEGNVVMAYLTASIGVLGILFLCKAVKYLPGISYFGRYSIIVLCVHRLITSQLRPVLKHLPEALMPYHDVIFIAVLLGLCALAIPVCRKWLPYVTAQKDLIGNPELKFNRIFS